MRPTLAVTTALFLFLGGAAAEAAGSRQLAETGGFLLGNAHRCGVPNERVEQAARVIHDLIGAASDDSKAKAAASSRFAEIFLANAFPDRESALLIPSCEVVIAQFERLEEHHRRAGLNRMGSETTPRFRRLSNIAGTSERLDRADRHHDVVPARNTRRAMLQRCTSDGPS